MIRTALAAYGGRRRPASALRAATALDRKEDPSAQMTSRGASWIITSEAESACFIVRAAF